MNNQIASPTTEVSDSQDAVRILDLIATDSAMSQREMASKSGLSLGLVNLIIKRLVRTGYIKVSTLNSKKVEYLLTPKGVSDKSHRTYQYFLQTVNTFRQMRVKLATVIQDLQNQGKNQFIIIGNSEISEMVELILIQMKNPDIKWERTNNTEAIPKKGVVLDCRPNSGTTKPLGISILSEVFGIS